MEQNKTELVAPCGIYCGICMRDLNRNLDHPIGKSGACKGCRVQNKHCAFIKQKCPELRKNQTNSCVECEKFPCNAIQVLDKRYQRDYNHSIINNTNFIRENGLDAFIVKMDNDFRCQKCGDVICVHN